MYEDQAGRRGSVAMKVNVLDRIATGVMVVFNDPASAENPALQVVPMALRCVRQSEP
jgi:hypothetical protein